MRKFPGKNGLTKMMRFDVYDRDTVKDVDLSKHDFIGSAQCCLYDVSSSLIGTAGGIRVRRLRVISDSYPPLVLLCTDSDLRKELEAEIEERSTP